MESFRRFPGTLQTKIFLIAGLNFRISIISKGWEDKNILAHKAVPGKADSFEVEHSGSFWIYVP